MQCPVRYNCAVVYAMETLHLDPVVYRALEKIHRLLSKYGRGNKTMEVGFDNPPPPSHQPIIGRAYEFGCYRQPNCP